MLAICLQRLDCSSEWFVGLKQANRLESLQTSLGCGSPETLSCVLFLRLPCIINLTAEQSTDHLYSWAGRPGEWLLLLASSIGRVRKKQVLISQLGPVTRFTNIRLATFRSRQNPRLSWWRGSIHLPQQLLSLSLCISCCSSLSPPRALSSCHYGLLDLTFGSAYLILFTSFPDLKNMKTISQSVIFRMCVNTRIHNLSHCNICVLSLLLATLWSAVLNGKTTTLTWIFPWG